MAFFLMDHLVQGGPKKLDQNLQTFDISHTFLALTAAKLSSVKNGPVFLAHLVYIKFICYPVSLPSVIYTSFHNSFLRYCGVYSSGTYYSCSKKTVLFLLAHPVCRCKSSLQGAISVWSGSVVTLFSLTEAVC